MLSNASKNKLKGFLAAILLSACAAAVGIDAGCNAYDEARLSMPFGAIATGPLEVAEWINNLDVRMFAVCGW